MPANDIFEKDASPLLDVTAQDRYDATNDLVSLRVKDEKIVISPKGSAIEEFKTTETVGVKPFPANMLVGTSTNEMVILLR